MANPNRALARVSKVAMWEVDGWAANFHDRRGFRGETAAKAFAEQLRGQGFKGARAMKSGRGAGDWSVRVPGTFVKPEFRHLHSVGVEHLTKEGA